jgi:hypothetical protein
MLNIVHAPISAGTILCPEDSGCRPANLTPSGPANQSQLGLAIFWGTHKSFRLLGTELFFRQPKNFFTFNKKKHANLEAQGLDEALQAGRGGGSSRPPSPRPDRLNPVPSLCLTPAFEVR